MNLAIRLLLKACLLVLALLSVLSCATFDFSNEPDPKVVDSVDLQKYQGLWYEIAHYPSFFQRNCVRSTAEYATLNAQSVSVHNICYEKDGATSYITGEATIPDPNVPAKLKVRFNFFAKGDYWIIDLDPNYQWAVVSGSRKKSLFILARQPRLPRQSLEKILLSLQNKGFEINKLIFDHYQLGP